MDNEIDKTEEKQSESNNPNGNPNWQKGMESPNPEGRPKGSKNYLTLLEEALLKYETETGKKLFDRLIQRAFINDNVLLNVIKKFIPDKTHTELEIPEPIKAIFEIVNAKDKGN